MNSSGASRTALLEALRTALAGKDLSAETAQAVMERVLRGEADAAWIAGWLVALRQKPESTDEIIGFVRALRTHVSSIRCSGEPLLDTCGTGGDRTGTFNISTASALVAAGAGAHVAKHGNRSVSSHCGSADVMEALGVELTIPHESVSRAVDEIGFGFLFAPRHHAALKHAVEPRRALGIRTVFNLLGPLANPAGAPHQVIGVYDPGLLRRLGGVLLALGTKRAMLVHGGDGLDELSVCAPSRTLLVDGSLSEDEVDPARLGLGPHPVGSLVGGDAARNAKIIRDILDGEPGPPRDAVVLNAAAALLVANLACDWPTAVACAAESIDGGSARTVLDEYVTFTRKQKADS